MSRRHSGSSRRRAGATLVELVIAIAVTSIALGGTLIATTATTRRSGDPMIQHQAVAIAEAYLEEILLKSYLDPDTSDVCPTAEASRGLFDNICDFANLDDNGARDQNGSPVAGLDAYRVRVAVDTTADLNGVTGINNVLRVDVRVTHPAAVDFTLSGYRTNT